MSFLKPDQAAATPAASTPEAAPPPVLAPTGTASKKKPQQRTFLGADATPGPMSGAGGGKTLLGE